MKLERFIENYDGAQFDVIVVGGGITGSAVAYEAASRGLKVALVEKSDFAGATSSATSKMIHGGFRYLAKAEFGLVRESLKERRIMTNISPNFVYPFPFLFSTYKKDKTPGWMIQLGMMLYEVLSFDKGWLWDKSKKMPRYRSLSVKEVSRQIPKANQRGLKGGYVYYDCINHFPERHTLAFIKSAAKYGASVSNYCELEDFIFCDSGANCRTIEGIVVKDKLNDQSKKVFGKLVINCAGPWADLVLNKTKSKTNGQHLRRSEGIHFITHKLLDNYIFAGTTPKNKHFFMVPYRNHTLVGTTDKEFIGNPDEYKVTRHSVEELLEDVNASFGNGEKIDYSDIKYVYGGLRPLVEDQTEDVYESSRKYEITDERKNNIEGLLTVEGGKYTTSRKLAENVINRAMKKTGLSTGKSNSAKTYLVNCEIENLGEFIRQKQNEYPEFAASQVAYLVKSYGREIDAVMKLSKENEKMFTPLNADGENLGQVLYSIRYEMARSLTDILLRRTGIGLLGHPGEEVLKKIADLAASELKWDENKKKEEIRRVTEKLNVP